MLEKLMWKVICGAHFFQHLQEFRNQLILFSSKVVTELHVPVNCSFRIMCVLFMCIRRLATPDKTVVHII